MARGPVPGSGVRGCRRGLWLDGPTAPSHTPVLHPTEHTSPRGAPERQACLHTAEGHLGPCPCLSSGHETSLSPRKIAAQLSLAA